MPALLATERVAVLDHAGGDVLVAHGRLLVPEARCLERLVKAEVAHDRGHDGVIGELALLVQVDAARVHDEVAVHDVAVLVDGNAAVRVAVIGKAHVEALLGNEVLELLDVRGTAAAVDVEAVGLVGHHVGLGAQRVEHTLGDGRGGAIGAVQADAHAVHGEARRGDEEADVAVAALDVVDRATDVLAGGQGHLGLAIDVVLDELEDLGLHLVAARVDELDAVVRVGVVARRDHDAAVKVLAADDVAHRGGRGDVEQVGVRAARDEARAQGVLEHVARATRVLADDDLCLAALAQAVVPAHEASDRERVVNREALVGATAEAIGAKVLHACSPKSVLGRPERRCPAC